MSGKQSRRRRHPVVESQPVRVSERRASPQVLIAVLLAVLVAIGAVAIVSIAGGRSPAKPTAVAGAAQARALFQGIAQHENVLGSPTAPVTVVEYADLQCPYCRDFDVASAPELVSRYVRTGKVKFVFRPLAFIGADSVRGRNAVIAAGLQGRLFEVAHLLYANQGPENTGWLDDSLLEAVVASVPSIELQQLLAAAGSPAVARRARAFDAEAAARGVRSTPTLLVGRSGGALRPVDGAKLAAAIDLAAR